MNLNVEKIDLGEKGMEQFLGSLETDVMECLWKKKNSTARDIYACLERKDIASTTIVVTLDRLHSKGLVARKVERGKGGLHYIYSPRMSKADLGERLSVLIARNMVSTFGPAVASYFSKSALEKIKKARA